MARDQLIITVRTLVEAHVEEEFNEWQFEEHVPWILSVDGYTSVRRYKEANKELSYINIWTLDDFAAYDSEDHEKKSKSPWGRRLRRFRQLRVEFYEKVKSIGLIPDTGNDYLSVIRFRVEDTQEKELKNWIVNEQLEALKLGGVSYAALYQRVRNGDGYMIRADFPTACGKEETAWTTIVDRIHNQADFQSAEAYLSMASTTFAK